MPLYGSSANNVILWGAISHELGHYTSIVRITVTSREWLVLHVRLIIIVHLPVVSCNIIIFPFPTTNKI